MPLPSLPIREDSSTRGFINAYICIYKFNVALQYALAPRERQSVNMRYVSGAVLLSLTRCGHGLIVSLSLVHGLILFVTSRGKRA